MLLEQKVAVIYGAGGPIGGAVARAFAREGARVFLAGRTKAKLDPRRRLRSAPKAASRTRPSSMPSTSARSTTMSTRWPRRPVRSISRST